MGRSVGCVHICRQQPMGCRSCCVRRSSRRNRRAHPCQILLSRGVLAAVGVALFFAGVYLQRFAWLPVWYSLAAGEVVTAMSAAFAVTCVLRSVSLQLRWFLAVEVLLAVLAAAWVLEAQRGAVAIVYPYWLIDVCVARGIEPRQVIRYASLLLAACPIVILLSIMPATPAGVWRVTGLLAILLFVMVGALRWKLPPTPPAKPPVPPQSPMSDEPPPPPPVPLAFVQFDRVGNDTCYLRTATKSAVSGEWFITCAYDELLSPSTLDSNAAALAAFFLPTNALAEATRLQRTFVYLFPGFSQVPALVNWCMATPHDHHEKFSHAFQMDSRVPDALALDSRYRRDNYVFRDASWPNGLYETFVYPPRHTVDSNVIHMSIGGASRSSPGDKLAAIVGWMNAALPYSARAGQTLEPHDVQGLLNARQPAGCRQFAYAAVLLCRSAGIPCRIAEGWRLPMDSRKFDYLLTDAHAYVWPEVFVAGTGWVPLPLNPTNVLDQETPPEQHDVEQEIVREQQSPPSAPPLRLHKHAPRVLRVTYAGVAVLLALWLGYSVGWRHYIRVWCTRPAWRHVALMTAAIDFAAAAGFRRVYGELRRPFAARVCSHDARFGQLIQQVTELHLIDQPLPLCRALALIIAMEWHVTMHYPARTLLPWYWLHADTPRFQSPVSQGRT